MTTLPGLPAGGTYGSFVLASARAHPQPGAPGSRAIAVHAPEVGSSLGATPRRSSVPRVVAPDGAVTDSSTATSSRGQAGSDPMPPSAEPPGARATAGRSGISILCPSASGSGTSASTRRRAPSASATTTAALTVSGSDGRPTSGSSGGSPVTRWTSVVMAIDVGRPGRGMPASVRRAPPSFARASRAVAPSPPAGSEAIRAAVVGSSARSAPPRTALPASSVRLSTGIAAVTPGRERYAAPAAHGRSSA